DCAREERCPRAWRPEDENEPIVEPAEALAESGAAPGSEALGDAEVVRRGLENGVHRSDSRSGGWTSRPSSSSVAPLESVHLSKEVNDGAGTRSGIRWSDGRADR